MAILTVLWLDCYSHMPGMNPTAPGQIFSPGVPNLTPKPTLGISRAMVRRSAIMVNSVSDSGTNLICDRLALTGNLNLIEQIPKLDGFFALNILESREIESLLYASKSTDSPAMQKFLGVSQSTTPGQLFRWTSSTNFSPWITGGQKPVFISKTNSLRWLADPARDFTREVSLPESLKGTVLITQPAAVQIIPGQVSAHRIEAQTVSAANALVVIAQSYYPAWKAYVDGQPVPLWRANHAFQALEVPAGRHRVLLQYEDGSFRLGLLISLGTVLFLVLAMAYKPLRNRWLDRQGGGPAEAAI